MVRTNRTYQRLELWLDDFRRGATEADRSESKDSKEEKGERSGSKQRQLGAGGHRMTRDDHPLSARGRANSVLSSPRSERKKDDGPSTECNDATAVGSTASAGVASTAGLSDKKAPAEAVARDEK